MTSLLAVLVAVNPPAVALALWPEEERRTITAAAVITAALAVAAAALSGPLVDLLNVSPATFQLAAAIVLGLVAARWLIAGIASVAAEGPENGWGRVVVPLLVPVLVTPQLAAISIAAGARDGVVPVIAGVAVGLALAAAAATAAKRRRTPWDTGARFVAVVALALALALAVDSIKTI